MWEFLLHFGTVYCHVLIGNMVQIILSMILTRQFVKVPMFLCSSIRNAMFEVLKVLFYLVTMLSIYIF